MCLISTHEKYLKKREYMNRRKELSISKICLSTKQFKRDMIMFINWIGYKLEAEPEKVF